MKRISTMQKIENSMMNFIRLAD